MHKRSKAKMAIKICVSIVALIVITLLALEIPKLIYQREDERLQKRVTKSDYSAVNTTVMMTDNQLSDAMLNNDSVFVETDKTYTDSQMNEYENRILQTLSESLSEKGQKALESVFNDKGANPKMKTLKILAIEDEVIYSGEIGILSFYNPVYMSSAGTIVFDMNSGKMLRISLWFWDESADYSEVTLDSSNKEVGFPEEDLWGVHDLNKSFLLAESYNDYTECFVQSGNSYLYINPYEIVNPHYESDEHGEYLCWDYNHASENLMQYVNDIELSYY